MSVGNRFQQNFHQENSEFQIRVCRVNGLESMFHYKYPFDCSKYHRCNTYMQKWTWRKSWGCNWVEVLSREKAPLKFLPQVYGLSEYFKNLEDLLLSSLPVYLRYWRCFSIFIKLSCPCVSGQKRFDLLILVPSFSGSTCASAPFKENQQVFWRHIHPVLKANVVHPQP